MTQIEVGVVKWEMCNRDGCTGIIDEHDDGLSCSCHINPPCSHCENHDQYCPECGWSNVEEENDANEQRRIRYAEEEKRMRPIWDARNAELERKRIENIELVDSAFEGKVKVDKIVSYVTKTWHSGYAVKGCAPIGTSWIDIKKHFNADYEEAMARGSIDPITGGFTLSQFTD